MSIPFYQNENNFDQSGVAASGAGIGGSASGSIGIMNFNYNTTNNIESSKIYTDKDIEINTTTGGSNKLKLATASVAGLGGAIGVGYGDLTVKGNNSTILKNSEVYSFDRDVTINTIDKTQTELEAKSFAVSGIASGGAVIGEVSSKAVNNVEISGGKITGRNININATRGESGKDTFKLNSTALSAAIGFGGSGLVADIDANDKVNFKIGEGNILTGTNININAENYQKTTTDVDASSVGIASANVTKVTNKQSGEAVIDVAKGTEIKSGNIKVNANMDGTQNLKVFALSVGGATVGYNSSKVIDTATAGAKLNGANITTTNANVDITSNNKVNQNATVTGVSAGFVASGTSRLETERNLTNEAVLVNSGKIEKFKTVNVAANTESNTDINVISGTGGVVEVSPEAAYLNDTATNSTTTKIDGKYKATNINVTAITTENEKRKIDATSASAVGYSGATLKHKDTTTTAVNIADKSEIETPNDLIFNVKNNITGASDLIGVGAGALRGNAADSSDIGSYTATLNLGNNTVYKTNKDFTAQSADELDVRSTNLLKAYDFASATVANSTNNFEFKNSVTGGKTTINAENIYLKAGESGKLNLSAIADHKGAAGTVKTNADNTINRADTVTVGDSSTLKAKTVNLTTKTGENLDLNLQSDVFNYSFIPFENAPNMSLAFNQVNIKKSVIINLPTFSKIKRKPTKIKIATVRMTAKIKLQRLKSLSKKLQKILRVTIQKNLKIKKPQVFPTAQQDKICRLSLSPARGLRLSTSPLSKQKLSLTA